MDYWFVWVPILMAGAVLCFVPDSVLPWRRSRPNDTTEVFQPPRELTSEETQEMRDLWKRRRAEHDARVRMAIWAPTVVMASPPATIGLVPEESLATRLELDVLSLAYRNDRVAESLSAQTREIRADLEQFWVRDRHEWDALMDRFDRSMRVITSRRSILETTE
jgi:hypothetical protein